MEETFKQWYERKCYEEAMPRCEEKSDNKLKQIVMRLYESGHKAEYISEIFGIPAGEAEKWISEEKNKDKILFWDEETGEELFNLELYKKLIKEKGEKRAKKEAKKKYKLELKQVVLNLFNDGQDIEYIASVTEKPRYTIEKWIVKAGEDPYKRAE